MMTLGRIVAASLGIMSAVSAVARPAAAEPKPKSHRPTPESRSPERLRYRRLLGFRSYAPHQGEQEIARRQRQAAEGRLRPENGLVQMKGNPDGQA